MAYLNKEWSNLGTVQGRNDDLPLILLILMAGLHNMNIQILPASRNQQPGDKHNDETKSFLFFLLLQ
jgi:hypothetical protein